MKLHHLKKLGRLGQALAGSVLFSSLARAQTLPWERPLQQLQTSLTGPIARSIGVIALAVCGGMLAFGGELSDFTKRVLMAILAISVMMLADGLLSGLGLNPTGG